jgi:hypothetical protein
LPHDGAGGALEEQRDGGQEEERCSTHAAS